MIHLTHPNGKPKTKVELAVDALHKACGFGTSESATENFLGLLQAAVECTESERKQSHEDGLCLDCLSALSGNLEEMLVEEFSGQK